MDKRVWLSPRALRLHAVILVVVPGFMALCIWQVHRALSGNSLSWAYVFEWPIFAAYAVYMWWRLVHEVAEDRPPPASAAGPPGGAAEASPDAVTGAASGPAAARPAPAGSSAALPVPDEESDAALAAYNEYLAQLAERDRAAGRRASVPGGGLEPPTSGSKGRRSAD
jgi:hypothetical protein